ncbi:hypothetical protein NLC29_00480 [Candidatus Aminicenantes bacterium AH-873-B07]|jgi:hypothetical protein|nr:hypothetical protein [Candidatus Aminicenantes bacterium AH-873-B07]
MPRRIDRRQKPAWQKLRKPIPPPTRIHRVRKGKRSYNRKDKRWKKEIEEIEE